ncbi:glycosyltransferase family 39 protein [Streptomyces althioticus]|uniref:glycosyltransferase family 39 protein n=1 Tax=Streptomyces althioticus TaxID=83380 RepID=UPI00339F7F37
MTTPHDPQPNPATEAPRPAPPPHGPQAAPDPADGGHQPPPGARGTADSTHTASAPHGPHPASAPHGPHPASAPHGPHRPSAPHGPHPPSAPHGTHAEAGTPRWARPALFALLLATGLLYLCNLHASGYANSFYSAAVQAGSQSWKAFFFGSLDAANAITVDKPPAALWPMALSVRLFGLNSWAILVPEVLMGVGAVAVVHASVRRRAGHGAALLAGAVLALTPVAALMFRFNNPDALLALLMAVACHLVVRALEDGRTKWLVWAGVAVGFAFLTKTLQAFLILPALAAVYAVCAPVRPRRRCVQLALAAVALVVSGGWWVAVVELWPASSRPYIGGSQNNSFLELTFGYNGLGRLNGDETGSVGGGGGPGGGGWGETGWDRMFNEEIGGQISWLLPAALILLVAALVVTRQAGRTDVTRAAFLVWGGSLLTTAAVFSFMAGIFHQYYTVALAPYLAAVTGMGAAVLWGRRRETWAALTLAGAVTVTAVWGYVLLHRTPDHLPWLRWLVLVGGLTAALGLVFAGRAGRRVVLAAAALGVAASLAGPTAYTLSTVREGHSGSIVTAGPASAGRGGGGRPPGGAQDGGPGGGGPGGGGLPGQGGGPGGGGGPQNGTPPNTDGTGGFPGGAPPNTNGTGAPPGGATTEAPGRGARGGTGMGGLLGGTDVDAEARRLLGTDAADHTWAAATVGAQNAASYQLATGEPVMAIGGFNGTDPSPTLAQFQRYVEDGRIHYFIPGGGGGRGDGTASRITAWVEAHFTQVTAGSATFYDLTRPTSES